MAETAVEQEEQETVTEAGQGKVSVHIYMPAEEYERAKKWARYAVLEEIIEGHPRGNFTDYCNFCFNLGEQYLKEYMLRKRGYR